MVGRVGVLALGLGLVGCSAPQPPARPTVAPRGRIAVLPLRVGAELTPHGELQPGATIADAPSELGETIARDLATKLGKSGLPVVDPDAVRGALTLVDTRDAGAPLAARLARRLGAELAVFGAVTRYREREGSAWAVVTPASVGYAVALLRVRDAVVVQIDRFEYTQHALSENLLDLPRFVRGGGRWLTCAEILDGALDETAARLALALGSAPPRPSRGRQ